MRQALTRRYEKVATGEAAAPDLILIDGGKGQHGVAREVLAELGLAYLPSVGVAKGEERKPGAETLFRDTARSEPLQLAPDHPGFHLIQEIRDEAHRFAIAGHRARRAKARGRSKLEDVAGIGPTRRRKLLAQFGGLDGVMACHRRGPVPRRWHQSQTGRRDTPTTAFQLTMPLNIPNLLTWARILLIPLFVCVFYLPADWLQPAQQNLLATVFFVVAAVTDWFDGWLARKLGQMTAFGAFLDPVADKLMVAAALVVLLKLGRVDAIVAFIIIGREITISALREWMANIGASKSVAVSFLGKLKTTAQMIAIPLLLFHDPLGGLIRSSPAPG